MSVTTAVGLGLTIFLVLVEDEHTLPRRCEKEDMKVPTKLKNVMLLETG